MADKELNTLLDIMDQVSAQIYERTGLNNELLGQNLTRDGITIQTSEAVPKDEMHFRDPSTGKLLGKITGIK